MNTQKLKDNWPRIKTVITDVDGVLTDGGMYYTADGGELKKFNVRDGVGAALLKAGGYTIGVMTGESLPLLERRMRKMGADFIYLGARDKLACLESYLARSGLEGEEIAYIGDEINDLCLIGKVGLFFAVQDANRLVREAADYILPVKGGEGALRVFAETVLSLEGSLRRARDKFQAENEAARKGHGTKGEYISLDD